MRPVKLKIIGLAVLGSAIASLTFAGHAPTSCSPLDSMGYAFLHPCFEGKNWKKTFETVDIVFPDTLCSQKLRPKFFDIGKNLDTTIAVFSSNSGDLFVMPAVYTQYIGACSDELDYLDPQKVSLPSIDFTSATPWYLVKDTAYGKDTVKVVIGASSQYCLAVTIKASSASVVRIDTLRMQSATAIAAISGDYSPSVKRDSCIWVTGANGMVRQFTYNRTAWGAEIRRDITGLTDTVLCARGLYAGTNTGRIYKRNASQTFVLDNALSAKAIHAIYPQGAIGAAGDFIELVGASWRLDTLGSGDYRYANFIKRPGGFGVELLDSKWKYSVFTYRDSSSKILLTLPSARFSYVNNGAYPYTNNPPDTGMSIYVLDVDSNYSDVAMTLKSPGRTINLTTDGAYTISPVSDSQLCSVGVLRLTNGVLNVRLSSNSVTLKTATELGTMNVTCLSCYWKNYSFSAQQPWGLGDTVIIAAGKDKLKILNGNGSTVTIARTFDPAINDSWCRILGHKLVIHSPPANLKSIAVYDMSGRMLISLKPSAQSVVELSRHISPGIVCVHFVFTNGKTVQYILPIL
jgi:hypothetical protein